MERFSPHSRFFSSLKQVEDRLASEKKNQESPSPIETTSDSDFKSNSSPTQSDLLSTPIYLIDPHSNSPDSSGPALDFLSETQISKEDEEQKKDK